MDCGGEKTAGLDSYLWRNNRPIQTVKNNSFNGQKKTEGDGWNQLEPDIINCCFHNFITVFPHLAGGVPSVEKRGISRSSCGKLDFSGQRPQIAASILDSVLWRDWQRAAGLSAAPECCGQPAEAKAGTTGREPIPVLIIECLAAVIRRAQGDLGGDKTWAVHIA